MSVVLERWQTGMIAGSVLVAGIAVAGSAFLGGYALGNTPAPPPPTELAEKTYTVEDLEKSLSACGISDATVAGGAVTLLGADYAGHVRQCVVVEMGATALAEREYSYDGLATPEEQRPMGGEHSWSNVSMAWEQTETGRDVTITVTH